MSAPVVVRSYQGQKGSSASPAPSPVSIAAVVTNVGETIEVQFKLGGAAPGAPSTITFGSNVFTLRKTVTNSTCRVDTYSTDPGAAVAFSGTATFAFTGSPDSAEVQILCITGALSIGATGSNTGTAANPTISLTTTAANSLVTGNFANADNTAATPTPTALTGNLDKADAVSAFGAYDMASAATDNNSVSIASVTNAITYSLTTGHWAAVAIEYRSILNNTKPINAVISQSIRRSSTW